MSKIVYASRNNCALQCSVTLSFAGCNSARKSHEKNYMIDSPGYDYFLSRSSTKLEEWLATKKVLVKVARRDFFE